MPWLLFFLLWRCASTDNLAWPLGWWQEHCPFLCQNLLIEEDRWLKQMWYRVKSNTLKHHLKLVSFIRKTNWPSMRDNADSGLERSWDARPGSLDTHNSQECHTLTYLRITFEDAKDISWDSSKWLQQKDTIITKKHYLIDTDIIKQDAPLSQAKAYLNPNWKCQTQLEQNNRPSFSSAL